MTERETVNQIISLENQLMADLEVERGKNADIIKIVAALNAKIRLQHEEIEGLRRAVNNAYNAPDIEIMDAGEYRQPSECRMCGRDWGVGGDGFCPSCRQIWNG